MKKTYLSRGISAALFLSLITTLQTTPVKASLLPQMLLGATVGTAAGVGVAKIEEAYFEKEDGSVPAKHRLWLWPASYFARIIVGNNLANIAGYGRMMVANIGSTQMPVLIVNDEFTNSAFLAAWASYFIARKYHHDCRKAEQEAAAAAQEEEPSPAA